MSNGMSNGTEFSGVKIPCPCMTCTGKEAEGQYILRSYTRVYEHLQEEGRPREAYWFPCPCAACNSTVGHKLPDIFKHVKDRGLCVPSDDAVGGDDAADDIAPSPDEHKYDSDDVLTTEPTRELRHDFVGRPDEFDVSESDGEEDDEGDPEEDDPFVNLDHDVGLLCKEMVTECGNAGASQSALTRSMKWWIQHMGKYLGEAVLGSLPQSWKVSCSLSLSLSLSVSLSYSYS
jgi:hypothetical protein